MAKGVYRFMVLDSAMAAAGFSLLAAGSSLLASSK